MGSPAIHMHTGPKHPGRARADSPTTMRGRSQRVGAVRGVKGGGVGEVKGGGSPEAGAGLGTWGRSHEQPSRGQGPADLYTLSSRPWLSERPPNIQSVSSGPGTMVCARRCRNRLAVSWGYTCHQHHTQMGGGGAGNGGGTHGCQLSVHQCLPDNVAGVKGHGAVGACKAVTAHTQAQALVRG